MERKEYKSREDLKDINESPAGILSRRQSQKQRKG